MKRVFWRFSSELAAAQAEFFSNGIPLSSNHNSVPLFSARTLRLTSPPFRVFPRHTCTLPPCDFSQVVKLFTEKPSSLPIEDFVTKASILKNELVREASDPVKVLEILDENSEYLLQRHQYGSVLLELMNQLDSRPSLALEAFNWRRKASGVGDPISAYEYSKGIRAAGRHKDTLLAAEIFQEALGKGIQTTSIYNALMGAFMYNGPAGKCQSLFSDMMRNSTCHPSIATYNILISAYGRLLLIDHMEAVFHELNISGITLNIKTYNNLIGGYIGAWMWDDMEKVFQMLKASPVQPDLKTYFLMLRGYALSGNIEKMEETYSLVRDHVNEKEFPLIRCMICAYCKSLDADKMKKIELLLKLIPKEEYRPWLNVRLIQLYAREDWLEEMENAINEAFDHGTSVTTVGVMRCIIASYFRCNAIEKLETFVNRAECSGWRICRSLYHCKLAMYGRAQNRFEEMRRVLNEMEAVNIPCSKKTLWIIYHAYWSSGQRSMVLKILGNMFKHGYEVPLSAFPS